MKSEFKNLSIYLSSIICMPIYLCHIYLCTTYISVIYLCWYIYHLLPFYYVYVYLPVSCVSVYQATYLPIISICSSIYFTVIYLYIYLSTRLSSICQFIYLTSAYLSISIYLAHLYLSVHLSSHPSFHPPLSLLFHLHIYLERKGLFAFSIIIITHLVISSTRHRGSAS